jgi:hypothetical protein
MQKRILFAEFTKNIANKIQIKIVTKRWTILSCLNRSNDSLMYFSSAIFFESISDISCSNLSAIHGFFFIWNIFMNKICLFSNSLDYLQYNYKLSHTNIHHEQLYHENEIVVQILYFFHCNILKQQIFVIK